MIRVVVVPIGKDSEVREIPRILESFRSIVGGSIEYVGMGSNIGVYVNTAAMDEKLPQNGCGFLGSYVFFKVDMAGNEISLSEEECRMIGAYVAANRQVRHSGGGLEIKTFNSGAELMEYLKQKRFDDQHSN
jgi:hypothetical protein